VLLGQDGEDVLRGAGGKVVFADPREGEWDLYILWLCMKMR
jgi:hypothetical protein